MKEIILSKPEIQRLYLALKPVALLYNKAFKGICSGFMRGYHSFKRIAEAVNEE